jgi:hypothetical protein
MLIVIRHFKQVFPHLSPIYKHNEILKTSVIRICIKKQAELLGYGLNLGNLHQNTEICFFRNRQNESKKFFTQRTIWYFVMLIALL